MFTKHPSYSVSLPKVQALSIFCQQGSLYFSTANHFLTILWGWRLLERGAYYPPTSNWFSVTTCSNMTGITGAVVSNIDSVTLTVDKRDADLACVFLISITCCFESNLDMDCRPPFNIKKLMAFQFYWNLGCWAGKITGHLGQSALSDNEWQWNCLLLIVYCTESHGVFCHLSPLSLSRMHPYLYTCAVPLCLLPAFFNGMTWNPKQKWFIESILAVLFS